MRWQVLLPVCYSALRDRQQQLVLPPYLGVTPFQGLLSKEVSALTRGGRNRLAVELW